MALNHKLQFIHPLEKVNYEPYEQFIFICEKMIKVMSIECLSMVYEGILVSF